MIMNIKSKVAILILILTAGIVLVAVEWLDHPLPVYEGQERLRGLKEVVDVYTDDYGVPHVFAKNEEDLFYTAGYIAGRDRLFQLSMVSLAVKGELASVLGKKYFNTDVYFRTWKIHKTAKGLIDKMSPENRRIFEYFCKGINHRIDEVKNDLPLEFKILDFEPSYWDPTIVAGYARLMAHEMSGSWKPEVVFGAIESYFGRDKLLELLPNKDVDMPTIADLNTKEIGLVYNKIIKEELTLRDILGDHSADIGSNNWVVSGSKIATGRPYLANDPHLAYTQPPRWYEIHLKGGRFNVSGVCIAGIPMPVIGQNERTAWGFTNSMVDDLDFFIETINPDNPNEYLHDDQWKKVTSWEEKISIKDQGDTTIIIRSTHHGPIISDIHPLLKKENTILSMAWTGHWITTEMDAWINLTTMKNWKDFTNALELFGVPGQNIVYADIDGNIGWRPAVFVPIRREGFSMVPRPGHLSEYDWKGRVPYKDMPFLYNPPKGYISTANNRTIDEGFPYYISGLWADPSRGKRIDMRLKTDSLLTMRDMKSIQLDVTNEFAKEVVPFLVSSGAGLDHDGAIRAYTLLKEWDCVEDLDSEAALVFHTLLDKLIYNIYGDELALIGKEYINAYKGLKYLTNRKLRGILKGERSSWIDNINTKDRIESISDIVKQSFVDSYTYISNTYGPNISNWKWGDAHSLTHKHLLGDVRVLDYLYKLNIGPYSSGGSDGTPNAGGYSRSKPFKQTSGASMRRIVDFEDLNSTQFVLPTGQSGLHNSPHYSDQASLYHDGEYRTTYFDEAYIRNAENFKKLSLVPH